MGLHSLNKVTIIGNVGKQPEMRYSQNGNAITKFSVAVNDGWKDKEGNLQEKTEWFNIVTFARLAETTNQYVGQGDLVYVEGRQETSKYTGDDGIERFYSNVVALDVKTLVSKGKAVGKDGAEGKVEEDTDDYDEDEFPF